MHIRKPSISKSSSGQSLVETALILPFLLMLLFNAINFGYFFLVALNLTTAPRSGAEYGILGFATPGTLVLPPAPASAAPSGNILSVGYLTYQDMTGAIHAPTGASLQICSKILGLSGTGASQVAKCVTCSSYTGSCSAAAAASGSLAPAADPEAPSFVLHRVDVTYSFKPLIPGTPFGMTLLATPICTSSGGTITCTFHRQVSIRAMD
jgi:hypothetical protein